MKQLLFALILVCSSMLPTQAWSARDSTDIQKEYNFVSDALQKHVVDEIWIDDNPQSLKLLSQQWGLAAEWVAAWLNEHPKLNESDEIKKAIIKLMPSETTEFQPLDSHTFLIAVSNPVPNVFIIGKSNGTYHPLWNIANQQQISGKTSDIIAAWQAKNAIHGARGPYFVSSSHAGPVLPSLKLLPNDSKGHARFYIDGSYAQSAGSTMGMQISLWVWDGLTAYPKLAKDYAFGSDQNVRLRIEGDILKVQQKKNFRRFYKMAPEEERQVEWMVHITPDDMNEIGEQVVVPELDSLDELLDRIIKRKTAADIASPSAIKSAEKVIQKEHGICYETDLKEYCMLGEMDYWSIAKHKNNETLCVTFNSGSYLITLKGKNFFITDIKETGKSCFQ